MKFVPLRSPRDDPFQHVGQPCQWIDVIQLRRLDQACDDGPMSPTTIGTREERIFSSESHRAHGAFDRVGIQFQPAIINEENQAFPVVQCITNGLGKGRTPGDARQLLGQPGMHGLDQRTALSLADPHAIISRLAADIVLDRIQGGDPAQRLVRDRGLRGGMDIEELPPCVRPAEGKPRRVGISTDQAAKPGYPSTCSSPRKPFR